MFGIRLGLTLAAIGLSLSAHADSIDCTRAKTRTERLICSDKALVSADSTLASAYYGAIDIAADQQAVVRSQRAWLAQRDACADAACIATAYRDRTAALKQVKHAGWKTYRDPALGISFEYLGNRQIKKPCPEIGGDRCVAIVGRNMTNSSYFIAFEIVDGALEPVAERKPASSGKTTANGCRRMVAARRKRSNASPAPAGVACARRSRAASAIRKPASTRPAANATGPC